MKTKLNLALIMLALFAGVHQTLAQGTVFTYQGRLQNNGAPANGAYDLQFILFSTSQFGFPAAPILTNAAVPVNNGLFTTTLDFGASVFTGTNYWLDISVRTNGNGTFNELSPRQPITPTPYAITAEMAETVNNLPGLTVQQNTAGAPNVILGSSVNFVASGVIGATIAGGGATNASEFFSPPSATNSVTADFGTVSGGAKNTAGGGATVGGGEFNTARGGATVGGGAENSASGDDATVGGGIANTASGGDATVGGGEENSASGGGATVPGGLNNVAEGGFSFAAGFDAQALHDGAFVWSDSTRTVTASTANNSVTFRASGGYRLFTSTGNAGVALAAGGTSWGTISDQNAKKNFAPVNGETVLDKLAQVPVEKWNYKWEKNSDTPNIGPMAQAFKAAFYPGRDDKIITTLEFDGVELAAIQGLNQKVEKENMELKQQNASLKKRLDELEATVKQMIPQN